MNGARGAAADVVTETFTAGATTPRAARHWAMPVLAAWGVNGMTDDVVLVVSELVTNAVCHGSGPVRVCLKRLSDVVRIEVTDTGAGAPAPREPDVGSPGGRGLSVIGYVARTWGVDPHAAGKTVWAELAPTDA